MPESYKCNLGSIFRSSPKNIKSEAAARVGKSQTERSVYFEAGEEGGEVKLVPASEANKVTAEPCSASGALTGPRLSIAGSFAPEQTKNVDNFTVRSIQSIISLIFCVEQNSTRPKR